jgi:hypothetical protein
MRYIRLIDDRPVDYTIEQLMIDKPDAVIYGQTRMPNEKLMANYDVYSLITEAKPVLNEDEVAEESTPEFRDGEWHQTWTIRKMSEQEIDEIVQSRSASGEDTTDATAGFFADNDIQKQRYEICKKFDSFTALKTCSECGCIMPLKIKIAGSRCPLEKWE